MCSHSYFRSDYSTKICLNCGLEISLPIDSRNNHYTLNQPLWVGYSRINRFRKILKTLFFPSAHGSVPGEIFVVMQRQGKFNTVSEMCNYLKSLKYKTKNYNAIHLYAKYFVKNYSAPTPPLQNIRQNILADFALLESGLEFFYPTRRFFSYRWLLIRLLQKYKLTRYVQYVKPLVNKISSKKYKEMFDKIMTASTRVEIPDILLNSEILPAQQLGDGFEYPASEYSGLHPSKFDLLRRAGGGCCRTAHSTVDSSNLSASQRVEALANRLGVVLSLHPLSPVEIPECHFRRFLADPAF